MTAATNEIRIPEIARPGLEKLGSMSEHTFQEIVAAFESLRPEQSDGKSKIRRSLGDGITDKESEVTMCAILSLFVIWLENTDASQFAEKVTCGLDELDDSERRSLAVRIQRLLRLDQILWIAAQALDPLVPAAVPDHPLANVMGAFRGESTWDDMIECIDENRRRMAAEDALSES